VNVKIKRLKLKRLADTVIAGFTDISLTNQLADSQLADKTTR